MTTTTLTVTPADFELLSEQRVLAVDGVPVPDPSNPPTTVRLSNGQPAERRTLRAVFGPPPDLLALVGKACETCRGDGIGDRCYVGSEAHCDDCDGSGSELLTVVTECEHVWGPDHMWLDCTGTRSLLVRLTGQPVRVGKAWCDFDPSGATALADDEGRVPAVIPTTVDPQTFVGRWVFLDCEVIRP